MNSSQQQPPDGHSTPMEEAAIARFGASLGRLSEELDWERLGKTYCWEGGEQFFSLGDRERLMDAGLAIATDLAAHLARLPDSGSARSLYVGVGLAEQVPLALEAIVLGRVVVARSLDGEEVRELARAATLVAGVVEGSLGPGRSLPVIEGRALGEEPPEGPFDHLWFVSLISDPEAFPALHDKLYGRDKRDAAPEQSDFATGRGSLAEDKRHAEELVELALAGVTPPAILTTTDEELPFFERALARRGWTLAMSKSARLSPIVGDPIRHGYIESADGA
jgi:hypothetical protein